MDCLSPPVEFVPLDEWFCPACSSHEELQAGESEDEQLREETCARTTHETTRETTLESTSEAPRGVTRGRPRESTAGRVSGLGRTGFVDNFLFSKIESLSLSFSFQQV